jgi:hypothetical protein
MDGGKEQRVAIKVSFKADLSVTETLVLVQKPYGNESLNLSNFYVVWGHPHATQRISLSLHDTVLITAVTAF